MKLILSKPIEAHGREVSELEFREPICGDLRGVRLQMSFSGLDEGNPSSAAFHLTVHADDLLTVAARLAGVPPSSLSKVPIADVLRIGAAVSPLLRGSQATGTS